MNYRMYLIGIAVTVLVLTQACSRKLDPEEPCNFVQSNQLQRVSWKENFPIQLLVHASVPREGYPAIEAAIEHWNTQLGKKVFEVSIWGVGGPIAPEQDHNNVIYWMENDWEADRSNQQARTTIYWTGSRIYEADMRINAKNFKFYFDLDASQIQFVDLESLVVHELGHVLGLAHNAEPSSVMQPELASGVDRRSISPIDVDSVRCEYF